MLIDSFVALVVCRLILLAACTSQFTTMNIWNMEIVGPNWRSFAGVVVQFGWVFGLLVLNLGAYLIRSWVYLALLMACPTVVFLGFVLLIPESPRWLLNKNHSERAMLVLKDIAKVNKVASFEDSVMEGLVEKYSTTGDAASHVSQEKSITEVFKSRIMLVRLIILCLNWVVCTMVYYGIALNMASLIEGDIFLNFFLNALLEGIGFALIAATIDKLGRKLVFCFSIIVSGLSCLATMVPVLVESDDQWINIVLSNIGRFSMNVAFGVVYFLTMELFPTGVRNSALSFCSGLGRLGSLVSPYIGNLHVLVGGKLGKTLPLVIFGGAGLFAGCLSIYLPEPNGKNLPETIKEAEAMRKIGRDRPIELCDRLTTVEKI